MKISHRLAILPSLIALAACTPMDTNSSTQHKSTDSAGTQILYWEVQPERVSCSHPLMPNYQCLSVRAVNYDVHTGLASPTGEWSFYYDQIQGYEHTPGQGALLKIKRQIRESVPADASRYQDTLLEKLTMP